MNNINQMECPHDIATTILAESPDAFVVVNVSFDGERSEYNDRELAKIGIGHYAYAKEGAKEGSCYNDTVKAVVMVMEHCTRSGELDFAGRFVAELGEQELLDLRIVEVQYTEDAGIVYTGTETTTPEYYIDDIFEQQGITLI